MTIPKRRYGVSECRMSSHVNLHVNLHVTHVRMSTTARMRARPVPHVRAQPGPRNGVDALETLA
jgi:hypothetical protein